MMTRNMEKRNKKKNKYKEKKKHPYKKGGRERVIKAKLKDSKKGDKN